MMGSSLQQHLQKTRMTSEELCINIRYSSFIRVIITIIELNNCILFSDSRAIRYWPFKRYVFN